MRFGLSGRGGGLEAEGDKPILELVELADHLGFDCLWFNEEHFSVEWGMRPELHFSPIVLAMAAAALTSRIRVGFSVLLVPLHDPIRLAEEIASLDVLSSGRVNFGVSRAADSHYSQAFGYDPKAGPSLEQCLDLIFGYWAGHPVEADRDQRTVEPRPLQLPHPPVFVGAYHDESIEWVARRGYTLMQHGIQCPTSLQRCLDVYAGAGGEVANVPIGRFCYVGESDKEARRDAWPTVVAQADRLHRIGLHKRGNLISTEADLDPERFYRETAIVGGPDTVVEQLRELRDTLGARYINLLSSFFGFLPQNLLHRSLQLFATEVAPRLA